jgi:hypothetical protein
MVDSTFRTLALSVPPNPSRLISIIEKFKASYVTTNTSSFLEPLELLEPPNPNIIDTTNSKCMQGLGLRFYYLITSIGMSHMDLKVNHFIVH